MIIVCSPTVTVKGDIVIFTFKDNGGANTRVLIAIDNIAIIQNNSGPQSQVTLTRGRSYNCSVVISAFKYQALNSRYDISITANGIHFASAKGDIPSMEASDIGRENLILSII